MRRQVEIVGNLADRPEGRGALGRPGRGGFAGFAHPGSNSFREVLTGVISVPGMPPTAGEHLADTAGRWVGRDVLPVMADRSDPARPVIILSVGRAVAKKGYDHLLAALALLPAGMHWRFVHIGGGPLFSALHVPREAQPRRAGSGRSGHDRDHSNDVRSIATLSGQSQAVERRAPR